MPDYRLNGLQEASESVFDDIYHLRTTGGLDKKITLPNLRQSLIKYTEISANFTAPETASEVNKVQIFKNTSASTITLTLGTSGKTVEMIPNQSAMVIYNGITFYILNENFDEYKITWAGSTNLGTTTNYTLIFDAWFEKEGFYSIRLGNNATESSALQYGEIIFYMKPLSYLESIRGGRTTTITIVLHGQYDGSPLAIRYINAITGWVLTGSLSTVTSLDYAYEVAYLGALK